MMGNNKKESWHPEIVYEDTDDGQLGNLPLVHVPPGEEMPKFLLIWEATDTGEIEPGPEGEEMPVVQWDLRQYAQMEVLKAKLSPIDYDKVRVALGLQPLKEAVAAGQKITQRVRDNIAAAELGSSSKKM